MMRLPFIKRHDITSAIDFLFVAVLLVFASVWAWSQFMESPPYVDPVRYPVKGIDVSSHNGMMNLDAARKDGVEFIFIKASEGVTFRDQNFNLNYSKARHAGMKIGAYHFFRFESDGVTQAMNLLRVIGDRELDLDVAIDAEKHGQKRNVPKDSVIDRLSAMADYLAMKGRNVIFYTNRDGYYDYLSPIFSDYPIWICSFSEYPLDADWQFWQFNHHGRIKGIRGDVDINVFNGSKKEFEEYCTELRKRNRSKQHTGRIQ